MTGTATEALARLTPRERDVYMALCETPTATNKEIAAGLGISTQVVKNYMKWICNKIGMSSRIELLIFAYGHGIAECPCGTHDNGQG